MNASSVAISIQGLSKRYRIGEREEAPDTLTRSLASWVGSPLASWRRLRRLTHFDDDESNVVWALRDVSFEIERGEVMGIVGRNGAGKSTLLKILSSITTPTSGRAVIEGDISSLLEVGTGFHPELTGRENVYLNGTILGLSKRQIDVRFSEIVAFAGIGNFLDTPVKRYSSGMRVRLAFSVAAHLEPEVLLIDEVLAVGDAAFQRKCLGKMHEVASAGRTVLFVSHNLAAVTALCTRAAFLADGRLAQLGEPREVIARYLEESMPSASADLDAASERRGSGALRITELRLVDRGGAPLQAVLVGQAVRVVFVWERGDATLEDVTFGMTFRDALGADVTTCWTEYTGESFARLPAHGEVECEIPRFPLMPGQYSLAFSIKVRGEVADAVDAAMTVSVLPGDYFGTGRGPKSRGLVMVDHRWRLAVPEDMPEIDA